MTQDPKPLFLNSPNPSRLQQKMDLKPDYGEDSYKGSVRVSGKKAGSPAPIPALVARWHWLLRGRAPTLQSPVSTKKRTRSKP